MSLILRKFFQLLDKDGWQAALKKTKVNLYLLTDINVLSMVERAKEDWNNYIKPRNFSVNLLCNTKKGYFQKLNIKDLTNYEKFWKSSKPFFSNKCLNSKKLMLREKNVVVSDEKLGPIVHWLPLLHNFIQLSLNSGSAQVQILLAACRRFAMVPAGRPEIRRNAFLRSIIPKKQFINS